MQPKTMRAILIDPVTKTVSAVTTDGKLASIYALLGCKTIEGVRVSTKGDTMYVDEEGLLHEEQQPFFAFLGRETTPFCGRGLILGVDREGDSAATTLDVATVYSQVVWPDIELVGFRDVSGQTGAGIFGETVPVIGSEAVFAPKRKEGEE